MRFEQISKTIRSLSFRLTAWNSLVVILVGVTVLFAAREGLRYSLIRETDVILGDEAAELVLSAQELFPSEENIADVLERKAETHAQHDWFLQLIDRRGVSIWRSGNFPNALENLPLPKSTGLRIVERGGFRVANRGVVVQGKPLYWIRVGTSTAFIDGDIDRVTRLMIPVGIAVMLLSPIGGYWLSLHAVGPLREIIVKTRALRPSRFDDRLPLRGTGDELDQLSEEINDFLDQIANHLERHHDFLANAAHELRSPLAAIRGSLDVALSRRRSAEEYEELLPSVIDECTRLSTLVDQLLILAENEGRSDRIRHERFRMDEPLRKSIEMFSGVAEEKDVRLTADIERGVEVVGCLPHLRQVIANLLDNAVKFTPPGGGVDVSLHRGESGKVVLKVRDTGVGIPPEDLPRVFDRFFRGDKSHQHSQGQYGTGLGLSICNAIVAAHRGKIEVQSTVGEGTSFTLTLPPVPQGLPPIEPPTAGESSSEEGVASCDGAEATQAMPSQT